MLRRCRPEAQSHFALQHLVFGGVASDRHGDLPDDVRQGSTARTGTSNLLPEPQAHGGFGMTPRTRLAVDIGGTFTDLVLALPDRTLSKKLLTTRSSRRGRDRRHAAIWFRRIFRPNGSILSSMARPRDQRADRAQRSADCLVTTRGFRDSLEMAYEHRFEQYDLYMERPRRWLPDLRLEVAERMAADGSVLLPLDEAACDP